MLSLSAAGECLNLNRGHSVLDGVILSGDRSSGEAKDLPGVHCPGRFLAPLVKARCIGMTPH